MLGGRFNMRGGALDGTSYASLPQQHKGVKLKS